MANDFVRSIRNVKDVSQVPFYTNEDNDLIQDKDGNVFIRIGLSYQRITGIEELEAMVKDLGNIDDELNTINQLKKDFKDLKTNYDKKIKGIATNKSNITKLKNQLTNMEHIDTKAREDAKSVSDKLKDTNKKVQNIQTRLEKLDTSNQDDTTTEDIETLRQQIESVANHTTTLEERLGDKANQKDIDNLNQSIENLQQNISNKNQQKEQLREEIDELRQQVANIKPPEVSQSDLKQIQDQLDEMKDQQPEVTTEDIEAIQNQLEDVLTNQDAKDWQKYKLTSNDGSRQYIKKADFEHIDKLPAGFYETVSDPDREQGLPDAIGNAYIQMDIFTSNHEDRRQYMLYESYSGDRYIKSKHSNEGNEQWFKLLTDKNTQVLSGIDLNSKDELSKLANGRHYVTGAKNKTDEMSTNNGWLTINDTGTIRRIEFQPYSHARTFLNYIYKDKLNEWEFIPNNKDIDNVFNTLTARYNDLAKAINS